MENTENRENIEKVAEKRGFLPDIAQDDKVFHAVSLNQVGMEDLEIPLLLGPPCQSSKSTVLAKGSFLVSLDDPKAKGIHMSRLFLLFQEQLLSTPLSTSSLQGLLQSAIESQGKLSSSAYLKLSFKSLMERKALRSAYKGWRAYPITLKATMKKGKMELELGAEVIYSSTCPCSAALARALIQKKFEERFKGKESLPFQEVHQWLSYPESMCATPHSQRSLAQVRVKVDALEDFSWEKLIDSVELALMTSVQGVVKREDEQEFARLNGQNLMFCEDAARRLYRQLQGEKKFKDFYIKVSHFESLHPHNAVSVVTKK